MGAEAHKYKPSKQVKNKKQNLHINPKIHCKYENAALLPSLHRSVRAEGKKPLSTFR